MIEHISYSCFEKFDWVIFDLDGTLCNTIGDIEDSLVSTFLRCGYSVPDMNSLEVGPPLSVMISDLLGGGVDTATIDKLSTQYRLHYESSAYDNSPLYEGVLELLIRLRNDGKRLGVATLKREISTLRLLDRRNLNGFFDAIYCCDSNNKKYNKEQMLAEIITKFNINPEKIIFFGDSVSDILAGQNNKITTAAILFGYGKQNELINSNPNYICKNYANILKK